MSDNMPINIARAYDILLHEQRMYPGASWVWENLSRIEIIGDERQGQEFALFAKGVFTALQIKVEIIDSTN